jgi:fluoride exporter
MYLKILLLAAGGAIGTVSRYAVAGFTHKYFDGTFPLGTLMVNVIGSLVIGFLWGTWETANISSHLRTFIFIGILGGFTTFSTFSLETLNLFREGEFKMAIINILANNILGIAMVFAGFFAARSLVNLIR